MPTILPQDLQKKWSGTVNSKSAKTIITVITALAVLTCLGVVLLTMASKDAGKKPTARAPQIKVSETKQFLDEDKEERSSREILDEIANTGSGSVMIKNCASSDAPVEKHEISRENYEKCGYDTGTYIIKYSDGTYDIVEGE